MILPDQNCILVTGGAGFIGSAVIRHLIEKNVKKIVNVDALTYAGNLSTLSGQSQYDGYVFEQVNICDQDALRDVIKRHQPDAIMHLAAESHVDRSIDGPGLFIETNVKGTYNLLELVREERTSQKSGRRQIRFHHISTDEVYGSLGEQGLFVEDSPYQPNSPYSASKAASDHLVRAWGETFGVDIVVSNCSNNYGPYQYPEKLIPVVIHRALDEEPIPVYGKGDNVRDWLFVDDHARALVTVMQSGENGRTYNIGGDSERTNLEVVHGICNVLDQLRPREQGSYSSLIEFVTDRPGHDFRYAIDATRIKTELGWSAKETFESGLHETVSWYLNNQEWV
ncbi:MAG: dTDP-glucose 4,6-dehydratase, partial [Proteobacteria bacterium]|nr:dTDP-glucose 4,6-dehydratase [Pseudomonadota bacterium]